MRRQPKLLRTFLQTHCREMVLIKSALAQPNSGNMHDVPGVPEWRLSAVWWQTLCTSASWHLVSSCWTVWKISSWWLNLHLLNWEHVLICQTNCEINNASHCFTVSKIIGPRRQPQGMALLFWQCKLNFLTLTSMNESSHKFQNIYSMHTVCNIHLCRSSWYQ